MLREDLYEQIAQMEALPTLPAVVVHLLELVQDETSDAERVAQVIESDQAMTGRTLQLVNSNLYGFRTPITTVRRAVSAIGYKAVRCMALGMSLVRIFSEKSGSKAFSMREFWKHSLACAVCARLLAEKTEGAVDPDEAFVAGLLHDLGRPLLASYDLAAYDRVVFRIDSEGEPILAAEEEELGGEPCKTRANGLRSNGGCPRFSLR